MGEKPNKEEVNKTATILKNEEKRVMKQLNRAVKKYAGKFEVAKSFWSDLNSNIADDWAFAMIDVLSGASLPKYAVVKKAQKSLNTLEAAVKSKQWKNMQQAFLNAERDINTLHNGVNKYYNDFISGANSTITTLKWTKTAGFVAIGVLATTFVGGPVAALAGLEGIKGAATAAAVGGVVKVQVDTVATTVGRELAGEDVDYGKVVLKDIKDSLGAAVTGAILQGPPAKWLNDKVAGTIVKDFIKDKDTLAICSRLGVSSTRTLLIKFMQSDGKKVVKKVVPKVTKGLKGKEAQNDVYARVLGEAAKSKEFVAFMKKHGAKKK